MWRLLCLEVVPENSVGGFMGGESRLMGGFGRYFVGERRLRGFE